MWTSLQLDNAVRTFGQHVQNCIQEYDYERKDYKYSLRWMLTEPEEQSEQERNRASVQFLQMLMPGVVKVSRRP